MSRQYFSETLSWITSSGTAVASTAAETIVVPNLTIPANLMQDGRLLRLRLYGGYGTTGTPTLTFRARWGGVAGTALATSGAITTGSGVGGGASMTAMWGLELYIQVRANGATGTVMTNGFAELATTGTAATSAYPVASGATGGTTPVIATVDLTADTALSVTVTWGTSNAANSIQCHNYSVEAIN